MRVSVVIPAYNEGEFLGKCLDSLKRQTIKPFEIIVVDNNSADDTAAIAKKYSAKIVVEKKQGMIFARNRGYDEASGDIIARTDADTILPPDWVEKIDKNFTQNELAGLTGPLVFYDLPLQSPVYANIYSQIASFFSGGGQILNGPNMAISKSVWNKIRTGICTDDKIVHEDVDTAIHIQKIGGKIKEDKTMIVKASGRRIANNPTSFFLEYPVRLARMFRNH